MLILIIFGFGIFLYIKKVAPPGEEWISYNNEQVIDSIDKQLKGMDIENIVKNKESYVVGKSISDIQRNVQKGNINYEEITAICLYRIKTIDQKVHGMNSVISVNPDAIKEARERDCTWVLPQENNIYGIPVMLKDNINTTDMPTSSGAEAFMDFYPKEDAALVKKLKENGAVLLGKNNLSEFSNYVSSIMPAGYSGSKGQTINPFKPLKLSASGSSSGSAVSVTADLVPVSIGTETDGSIIAPAAMNSVVGFKPARGTIDGEGIFPLIKKIDSAGTIAKSVEDAVIAYNSVSNSKLSPDFDKNALSGKKIGLVSFSYDDEKMVASLKNELQNMGCAVVNVDLDEEGVIIFGNISLSFKQDFSEYAEKYDLPIKTLSDLLNYNLEDPDRRVKYGQDWLEEANATETVDMNMIDESIQKAQASMTTLFSEEVLDGIVFLNSSRSTLPAAAGYPVLTVPFGSNAKGVPCGVTFSTLSGQDEMLIDLGYSFESSMQGRIILENL